MLLVELNFKTKEELSKNVQNSIENALKEIPEVDSAHIPKPNKRQMSGVEIGVSFLISVASSTAFKLIEPKIDEIVKKYIKKENIVKIQGNKLIDDSTE